MSYQPTIQFTDRAPTVDQLDGFDLNAIRQPRTNMLRPLFKPVLKKNENHEQSSFMVRTLAHEVRNPLNNILLSLEIIGPSVNEIHITKYLEIITRNTNRINDLINTMLHTYVNEDEKSQFCSISKSIDEVLELAKDNIAIKHVEVKKTYANGNDQLMVDVPAIKIAFLNIVINAIDAMPQRNGLLKIDVSSDSRLLKVIIEDNGCGISESNLQKIYTPFFTTKPAGLGIGLSTTLTILKSQRATITVESELKKGTRFTILFNKKQDLNA